MVTSPFKNRPGKAKREKTKKITTRDIFRSWGIPEALVKMNWKPRYKNPIEKGIYWFFFSLAVRKRDVEGWGTCISCNKPITVETSDAGHFIPASTCGPHLLFDPRNVNAECYRCNAWDDLHLLGYARNLDKRYGAGTAEELLELHRLRKLNSLAKKDFTRKEYAAKITELQVHGL